MIDYISKVVCSISPWAELNTVATVLITIVSIFLLSYIVNFIAKRYIVSFTQRMLTKFNRKWADVIYRYKSLHKLSHIAPGLVVYSFANAFQSHSFEVVKTFGHVLELLSASYIVLAVAFSLSSLLNAINSIYNLYSVSKKLPIKTYIQVLQLLLFTFTAIVVISILLETSPLVFFTGLGAATAIIMLVFKDSILGFVSSVQLSLYDIVRIGDWIEVPSLKIDGDVIEVSLSTVSIRNFDKTISTIPTYSLMTNGVQNWRGMKESGGRRIKRSLKIDIHSVKFCDSKELEDYKNIEFISDYIDETVKNFKDANGHILNTNPVSNLTVFRNYAREYLRNNPNIHKEGFTFLVRELEPSHDGGLPLQVYVFVNDTDWVNYEEVQSLVIDHLICAAGCFGLNIFQRRS